MDITITVGTTGGVANKVLLMPVISISNNAYSGLRMTRTTSGSTSVVNAIGNSAGNRTQAFSWTEHHNNHIIKNLTTSFLDSPGAGTHQYKVQAGSPYDGSYYTDINRTASDDNYSYTGRVCSTFTIMEVLP